jgi:hypothetical protein
VKVFELALQRGVNAKELAKELGLKSHLSIIPEKVVSELSPEVIEEVAVKVEEKPKGYVPRATPEEMIGSIRGLGTKSIYWHLRKELGQ